MRKNKNDGAISIVNKIKPGGSVRISDVIKDKDGYICILRPYHSRVLPIYQNSSEINSCLDKINYKSDESHWLIAISKPKKN